MQLTGQYELYDSLPELKKRNQQKVDFQKNILQKESGFLIPHLTASSVQIENDQSEAKRHRHDEDDRGREAQLLMPPNPHRFPPGFPPTPEPHNPLPPHGPLFLPPLGLPLPPDKSPVFPGMIDPRPLYMQVDFP